MHTISYLSTEYYKGVYDILKELETLLIRKNKDFKTFLENNKDKIQQIVKQIKG